MTPAPGPSLDDDQAGRRPWWDGDRPRRVRTAVGARLRPRAEDPASTPPPDGTGFPFIRPRTRDWVFWWAVALATVALVGLAIDVTQRYDGFNLSAWLIDGAIGLPLIFVVAVLPVAAVRALVRAQRTRAETRRNRA